MVVNKPKGDGFFKKRIELDNTASEILNKNNNDYEENLSNDSDNFRDLLHRNIPNE